jgi:uncharacterized membrane protein
MDATTPAQTPPPSNAGEDKTVAILSYLTLIGFIVAIIIHNGKKTQLGAFHLRQVLGLMLTGFAVMVCGFVLGRIPLIGWLTMLALWLSMLVLWLLGLLAALNGQMKPMPIVGPLYQQWFGKAFE